MKSSSIQPSLGFSLSVRKTRKAIFLDQMDRVVPWSRLVDLIAPHYPSGHTGRPPFELETMLRTHFLQQWFNLSDPAMEEAFFDTPLYREFVGLADNVRLPDESTILRFRHRLEKHSLAVKILAEVNAVLTERGLMLKEGSAVDATLIAAPSSTKNKGKTRDPEMHSSQKGNQWHFGMKSHIGVDADSGLVHTVHCTSGNMHDITQAHRLLHGSEKSVWADAGYQGVEKRLGADAHVTWHVAMRPGKRKTLKNAGGAMGELLDKAEKLKAGVRAKVEHPFRVIKRQFGYVKVRYRGLAKNAAQIATLFALSNVWMARHRLLGAQA
ncbi:MAG: IS5 family transposase [Rhodoferax sp.]|jgi:IS5 family transposase|nr:IS5 family transposase [Rhodoferax sp.]